MSVIEIHHYVDLVIVQISLDHTDVTVQLVIDLIIKPVSVCGTYNRTADHFIYFLLS